MIRFTFFIFLITVSSLVKAQNIKTDVVVIGNQNAAAAAGIQAAVSGVKTILILQAGGFNIEAFNNDLHSGLQADFLKKMNADSSLKMEKFDKQHANNILTTWTDSLKNLTVIRNVVITKVERSGNFWNIKLSDGSTIKPKILINVGETKINNALKQVEKTQLWQTLNYENTEFKTSIASGKLVNTSNGNYFSLYQLLVPELDNYIWLSDSTSMLIGQAAGATGAWPAFFSKKTSEANLKAIQGELINYKLNLLPFEDLAQDSNWKAIQFVSITGIIKAKQTETGFQYLPDQIVTAAEIKQPMKDHFYKAQLWFDDYKNDILTVGAAIDLVRYTGNKSLAHITNTIEKNWNTVYNFKSTFDLSKPITRREFAVLLHNYSPPFDVNINNKGKIIR